MRPRVRVSGMILLVLLLVGCGGAGPATPPTDTGAIRLVSYDFAENQVLAAVYAEGLRRTGLPVIVHQAVGTREVVEPALEQGVADVVIDYAGTALRFTRPGGSTSGLSSDQLRAQLATELGGRGVSVLAAASAEDQNGFAVSEAFARGHGGLARLSQLAAFAPGLTFAGPPECPERPLCLPGLRDVYGLQFGRVRSLPSRAATVEALVDGDIDVGLLETTDARLGTAPVALLADDRGLQPHENVVPLVRTTALRRWGDRLRASLDATSARLTTAELVRLNRSVEVDHLTPETAATRWWAGG